MNSEAKPRRVYPFIILNLIFALPLTLLFLHLVGSYWAYWDMGSDGGNGFALLFLYSPTILVLFLGTAVLAPLAASARGVMRRGLFTTSVICLGVVFVAAFLIEVWRVSNYPTFRAGSMSDFLATYLRRWL